MSFYKLTRAQILSDINWKPSNIPEWTFWLENFRNSKTAEHAVQAGIGSNEFIVHKDRFNPMNSFSDAFNHVLYDVTPPNPFEHPEYFSIHIPKKEENILIDMAILAILFP